MAALKKMIWRIMPNFTHLWIRNLYFAGRLIPNACYDAWRFFAYSGLNKSRDYQGEQAARITMAYHQLEKGLSFASPRPGFGRKSATRLISAIEPFVNRYGFIPPATTAVGVLKSYITFNELNDIDMSETKRSVEKLESFAARTEDCTGGVVSIDLMQLEQNRAAGFKRFFNSRYSIRHYSGGEIPDEHIIDATQTAQKTPSVCNRQAWKVHAFKNKSVMRQLLEIQSGNRGFGEQASAVLIITCDLTRFVHVGERFQPWIDGGMFSMSLCLAFHDLGYGTCCLNWSKEYDDDLALRKIARIDPQEQVIMMMTVGTLPEHFNAARSIRRPLGEILQIHAE